MCQGCQDNGPHASWLHSYHRFINTNYKATSLSPVWRLTVIFRKFNLDNCSTFTSATKSKPLSWTASNDTARHLRAMSDMIPCCGQFSAKKLIWTFSMSTVCMKSSFVSGSIRGTDFHCSGPLTWRLEKILDQAQSLLKEALKWGAFLEFSDNHYLWDKNIVANHLSSQDATLSWMSMARAQAKSRYPRDETPPRPTRASMGPPQTPTRGTTSSKNNRSSLKTTPSKSLRSTNPPPRTPTNARGGRRAVITTPSQPRRCPPVDVHGAPARHRLHRRAISLDPSLTSNIFNLTSGRKKTPGRPQTTRAETSTSLANFVQTLNLPGLKRSGVMAQEGPRALGPSSNHDTQELDISVDAHGRLAHMVEKMDIDPQPSPSSFSPVGVSQATAGLAESPMTPFTFRMGAPFPVPDASPSEFNPGGSRSSTVQPSPRLRQKNGQHFPRGHQSSRARKWANTMPSGSASFIYQTPTRTRISRRPSPRTQGVEESAKRRKRVSFVAPEKKGPWRRFDGGKLDHSKAWTFLSRRELVGYFND